MEYYLLSGKVGLLDVGCSVAATGETRLLSPNIATS